MRLLSYNIHKGIGGRDRRYRIERVIDVIASENPDLVCLQEVDRHVRRTRYDDQPRKLAEASDRRDVLSAQRATRAGGGGYGNLVLVLAVSLDASGLAPDETPTAPGAQLAVVETPEGPFHLVHWHLGLAERERHWQVGHLLDHPLFRESGALRPR